MPFTMRPSNNIVDAASRGDDTIAIANLLSSMISSLSLDSTNISKMSLEQVSLPPRMEQAVSAAFYNGCIVAAVDAVLKLLPPVQRVVALEMGAGSGGTTSSSWSRPRWWGTRKRSSARSQV